MTYKLMNRFLTRFFKTNCSKEPVLWNESDFTPPASKSNVNVSRFLTTITAVGAYLYFMDPIINKDTLLPVHFPRTSFKAVTLFIIPRVRLGVVPKVPNQSQTFSLKYPCTRSVRLCVRSHCCSRKALIRERRRIPHYGAAGGMKQIQP